MNKARNESMVAFDELPEDYEGLDEDLAVLECNDEVENNSASTDHQIVACILDDCKELLLRKGQDYNNGRVKMGDYYPRGVHSVIDIMNAKILRMYSLLESGKDANFESIEDSAKDLINYAGIFIGISRGLIKTPASRKS